MPRKVIVKKKHGSRRQRSASRGRSPTRRRVQFLPAAISGSKGHLQTEASYAYVNLVKETFREDPEVYQKFVSILTDVSIPQKSNILEVVDQIVALFDGYPELIFSFNTFLPSNYEIQVQEDAVVVKVYERSETGEHWDTRGRSKQLYGEAVGYIQDVKHTLSYDPQKYKDFMEILSDFHAKKETEVVTVRKIVRLLKDHPHLVLGFNEFLPEEYHIHMYSENSYTIQYPDAKGRDVKVTLNLF